MIRMLGASLNSRFEKGKRGTTLKWQKKNRKPGLGGNPRLSVRLSGDFRIDYHNSSFLEKRGWPAPIPRPGLRFRRVFDLQNGCPFHGLSNVVSELLST